MVAGLGAPASAVADPLAECQAVSVDRRALQTCLDRRLEESYQTMTDALGGARAVAQDIEQRSGRETAVLGVEASQQAWEAYRDTVCRTWAAFVDGGGEADAVELACEIEQTDQRTELLLGLATSGAR